MKIIWKYIFTNVKERKMRTAVMLLSILLSTTLLFVSFSIGASYESAQRKMARGMAGSATLSLTAAEGTIRTDILPNSASIRASVGILKGSALYHENGYYETVDLIAADLTGLNEINPPRLVNGGEITEFTGNQVILPDRFTSKYGIEQGDTITLRISGQPVSLEVAEITAYDTVFLRHTRGATALLPVATLSGLLGQTDGYTKILVEPADSVSTSALKNELTAALPDSQYRVSEVANEAQIAADARQKSMPFFLISFFSLTMSVFIIYSSYKVITLDRLPVIGTFRSIGATQEAVTRILLLESALYGVMGGVAGIPVGALVLKLILQGMGQSLSQGIEIPVVISPFSMISSFAVALGVSLLSAWLPVKRASRLPVKDVVLGSVEEKHIPRRLIVEAGVLLFAVSLVPPKLASGNMLYLAGGFSLLGLIAATILMIPLLTNLLSMGLERLYGIFLGNEGRLAARNMRDNKNIAQNITLLFISISAVIAITVVGAFLQPMHSMTWFILLLAAVGGINNLLINYLQKRRSIAMYKSVGLSNRQNMKMTLVEGFSSGLAGAMIAVFVSYMEIQTIFLVAGPKISTVPELNANTFLSAGGMGILVTLLGSVVPIFKSRSMKLVEEIKFE